MIRKMFDLWRAFVWWLKGPYNQKFGIACMVSLALCLAACEEKKLEVRPPMQIAVVDVEKVLKESSASVEGRQHLKKAQKLLQDGWVQLQKAWEDAPQQDKAKVLSEGFRALNIQMANEEKAANQVVLKLMRDAVRVWRNNNDAICVIAMQNMLDVADANNITAEIIAMMDKRSAKFADLPKVQVHEPRAKNQPKDENKSAAPKKQ